jgi:hypothetical protein
MRLQELGQLKNPMTSSGIETATFRFAPQPTALTRAPLLHKYDLKVCDDGSVVQILCFWTLSIVRFFI